MIGDKLFSTTSSGNHTVDKFDFSYNMNRDSVTAKDQTYILLTSSGDKPKHAKASVSTCP